MTDEPTNVREAWTKANEEVAAETRADSIRPTPVVVIQPTHKNLGPLILKGIAATFIVCCVNAWIVCFLMPPVLDAHWSYLRCLGLVVLIKALLGAVRFGGSRQSNLLKHWPWP
jgi:hypothetical protein